MPSSNKVGAPNHAKPHNAKGRKTVQDPRIADNTNTQWPPVPAPLMDMVFNLLYEHGYRKAGECIRTETEIREKKGTTAIPSSWTQAAKNYPSLVEVFKEWQAHHPDVKRDTDVKTEKADKSGRKKGNKAADNANDEIDEGEESDDESSSSSESEEASDSSDSEDSSSAQKANVPPKIAKANGTNEKITTSTDDSSSDSSEDEKAVATQPKPKVKSRKHGAAPSGSDSSSSSSDSSDGENTTAALPKVNALKRKATSPDSSSSSSGSPSASDADTSSSDDEAEQPVPKLPAAAHLKRKAPPSSSESSSSESSSDSDSSSNSSSGSDRKPLKKKAKTTAAVAEPLKVEDVNMADLGSGSDSNDDNSSSSDSSSSSSESDSENDSVAAKETSATKNVKTTGASAINGQTSNGSESSATITRTSPEFQVVDPAILATDETPKATKRSKKVYEPFSRIPKDQAVDPRFADNSYQSYDYAERAHQDLSVVKGKNFTKEKNKKKRGSYKGGAIDTIGVKAIKFDD